LARIGDHHDYGYRFRRRTGQRRRQRDHAGRDPAGTAAAHAARRAAPGAGQRVGASSGPPPGLQAFDLRFRVDPDLHEVVVTMVDPDSGSVLRQIPARTH